MEDQRTGQKEFCEECERRMHVGKESGKYRAAIVSYQVGLFDQLKQEKNTSEVLPRHN